MKIIKKDILTVNFGIIAHQANAAGVMGAGLAGAIKEKYPAVFRLYRNEITRGRLGLSDCQVVSINGNLYVANLIGQKEYGWGLGRRYTDYAALSMALAKLKIFSLSMPHLPVYFPYMMGCGLGGGDWAIVKPLILDAFPSARICSLEEIDEDH